MVESEVVVGMLQALSQEVARYRYHASQIEAGLAVAADQVNEAATEAMQRADDAITAMTAPLKAHVVPRDGLGNAYESMIELVLRARRIVIVAEMGRLRDLLSDSAASARARTWFADRPHGRFKTVDDVSAFFYEQFHQINCMWMRYRQHDRRAATIYDTVRITLYGRAIRVAQRTLRELLDDPDLVHLFRHGLAATDWPAGRSAFLLITTALAIEIDAEPNWLLPVSARPRSPDGECGKPSGRHTGHREGLG